LLYPLVVVFLLAAAPPLTGSTQGAAALYEKAGRAYRPFWVDENAKNHRANWLEIIRRFEAVYENYPRSEEAPKAYYMAGKLSFYCYKYHENPADFERGLYNLRSLIRNFGSHSLADDARYFIAELYLKKNQVDMAAYNYRRVIEDYPEGDMKRDARQRLEQLHLWPMPAWLLKYDPNAPGASAADSLDALLAQQAPLPDNARPSPLPSPSSPDSPPQPPLPTISTGKVLVKEIKSYSSGNYTRVVVYCDEKVDFTEPTYIPSSPEDGVNYPRLFIDIKNARLAPGAGRPKKVEDGLLRRVRAGQNTPKVVRVVLDIDSIDKDKTRLIPMEDEKGGDFRIVMDVTGEKSARPDGRYETNEQIEAEKRLVRKIVIDPGHGGKDPGAVGPSGLKEKNVTLALARKTAASLRQLTNARVLLTRDSDRYLSLEERTAYANVAGADVFISLHTNAHPNKNARGIETYILDTTNDASAKRLAALENKVSLDALERFQKNSLLFTLFQKAKADESYQLACLVQKHMIGGLRAGYRDVFDHGVREAPFFVLMGATMPCILVEGSFISNPTEEKRLRNEKYLDIMGRSIAEGVAEFARLRQMGPIADL